MEQLQKKKIMEKMQNIKQKWETVFSNCYHIFFQQSELWFDVQQSEKSIVFGQRDGIVYRVYFCTAEETDLISLLKDYPRESVIDFTAHKKDDFDSLFQIFQLSGYRYQALYERYHIRDLKNSMYSHIPAEFQNLRADMYGRYALESEAEEILRLLYDTFEPKESHLQPLEKIKEMACNHNLKVVTEHGRIVTLVAFLLQGKKLYIEQVLNNGPREYMHCLYLSVLEEAVRKGINYAYTWVNAKNEKGRRLAMRFGNEKDGLVDYIFVKGGKS